MFVTVHFVKCVELYVIKFRVKYTFNNCYFNVHRTEIVGVVVLMVVGIVVVMVVGVVV